MILEPRTLEALEDTTVARKKLISLIARKFKTVAIKATSKSDKKTVTLP
jgi:hypothetical protein